MKRLIASLAVLVTSGFVAVTGGVALAAPLPGQLCPAGDSGKIDTTGDPATVTITAPAGMVIYQYCVKAGSVKQGFGAVTVTVNSPVASLTISYPGGKAISHYSFWWRPGDAPPPPGHEPPVDEPPVHEPPVHEPPVHEPPVHEPPVDEPPVHEPPVHEPPVDEPPVHEPPVHEDPVHEPAVDECPPPPAHH